MPITRKLVLFSIFALSLNSPLAAETVRQHDAHEHGVSKLQIAIDANKVQFLLEAPGADIVGFEHEAETDDQKAAMALALDLLNRPEKIFALPAAAGCMTPSATAKLSHHDDEEVKGGKDKHDVSEEEHGEFRATYLFECSSPGELKTIGLGFFDQFPKANEIELQAISEFGQMAAEISRDVKTIDLSDIIQ